MESRIPDEISLTRRARSRCSAKLRARTRTSLSCWAQHTPGGMGGHHRSMTLKTCCGFEQNTVYIKCTHFVIEA